MAEIKEPSTSLATDWLDYLTGQLSRDSVFAHFRRAGEESGLRPWQQQFASFLTGICAIAALVATFLADRLGNWFALLVGLDALIYLWATFLVYARPLRRSLHRSIAEWLQSGASQTLSLEDQRRLRSLTVAPRSYLPELGTVVVWNGKLTRVLLLSAPILCVCAAAFASGSAIVGVCSLPFVLLLVILTQLIFVSSTASTARDRLQDSKCAACGFPNESPHMHVCPECGIGRPPALTR